MDLPQEFESQARLWLGETRYGRLAAALQEEPSVSVRLNPAKAVGAVGSLADMRAIVRNSVSLDTYLPEDTGAWAEAYGRYRAVTGLE